MKQGIKEKRLWRRLTILLAVILILLPVCGWQNSTLVLTALEYESSRLPREFNGCRILQVSDLHDNRYGRDQKRLMELAKQAAPDYIFLTGDLIESRGMENAMSFVKQAVKLAPVYYVPGNHEANSPRAYAVLRKRLEGAGAVVLEDRAVTLQRGEGQISLLGLKDPAFTNGGRLEAELPTVEQCLAQLAGRSRTAEQVSARIYPGGEEPFRILLSHRPELAELYRQYGIDLVFSGHTHGGLIRLPGLGAIYGLNQGFFPQYTEGIQKAGNTAIVISRGAGNNPIGLRINNFPELVVVELHQKAQKAPDV